MAGGTSSPPDPPDTLARGGPTPHAARVGHSLCSFPIRGDFVPAGPPYRNVYATTLPLPGSAMYCLPPTTYVMGVDSEF